MIQNILKNMHRTHILISSSCWIWSGGTWVTEYLRAGGKWTSADHNDAETRAWMSTKERDQGDTEWHLIIFILRQIQRFDGKILRPRERQGEEFGGCSSGTRSWSIHCPASPIPVKPLIIDSNPSRMQDEKLFSAVQRTRNVPTSFSPSHVNCEPYMQNHTPALD